MDGVEATRRIAGRAGGRSPREDPDPHDLRPRRVRPTRRCAPAPAGSSSRTSRRRSSSQRSGWSRPGDALVAPSVTRRLLDRFAAVAAVDGAAPGRLAELTEREREVLAPRRPRAVERRRSREQLFLGETTVKTHVSRILMKLDLRDRVQAVVLAYESGVVRPRRPRRGSKPGLTPCAPGHPPG